MHSSGLSDSRRRNLSWGRMRAKQLSLRPPEGKRGKSKISLPSTMDSQLLCSATTWSGGESASRHTIRFPSTVNTRGLIYKTMRRIFTKSLRAPKSQKWRTPKNIPIYKTVRTHTCKQCSLYKSQITRRCAYVNQPHIPPCTRPFLTINSQCKSPHDC